MALPGQSSSRRTREPGWTLDDEIDYSIKLEDETDRLRTALMRVYRDRTERDKVFAECTSVLPRWLLEEFARQ